ncbi:transposase [archaeon SCG-AAA382B04]|nr:transposase [archaeon SCG-AAA382B04]
MKAEKTIICRILEPTKRKKGLLIKELSNANGYIRGQTTDLYSATKQAMNKYIQKDELKEEHTYPLFLRNDTFRVEEAKSTKEFSYWAKIPVSGVWGGVWVPIRPHEPIKEEHEVKDSKVVWKPYGFELHLSISFDVAPQTPKNVLAVDLGERVMVAAVSTADNGNPNLLGKDVRGTRRHYAYLRKKLQGIGESRIKEVEDKESRVVEDRLHEVSKKIVDGADGEDALIVLGDLKGLGNKDTNKGARMNRIANTMPYHKLTKMITYKAKEKGIRVIQLSERLSSKTCHRCGSENTNRPTQGRFDCNTCGLRNYNADLNGAKNILYRSLAYMVGDGAVVNQPKTKASIAKSRFRYGTSPWKPLPNL